MSAGDISELGKADQISFHFFTKTYGLVYDSRATEVSTRGSGRTDKWFSLETSESDMSKDQRDTYRHLSSSFPPGPQPLEIQVLLAVPELSHNRVLVLSPSQPLNPYIPTSPTTPIPRILISPTPRYVLLESVTARFTQGERDSIEISKMYKHGIPHFRSLYTALRILPSWKLVKRIRRRPGLGGGGLGIVVRVRPVQRDPGVLGFDMSPCPGYAPLETSVQRFPPIPHPLGSLSVEIRYLTDTAFMLDDLESHLSSGFAAMDRIAPAAYVQEEEEEEEEPFVPTLQRQAQRESVGSLASQRTGGSLVSQRSGVSGVSAGVGAERAGGGVDSTSIAERFVLPSRTAGWKASGSPSTTGTAVGGTGGLSAAARLRKESFGGSGASLSGSSSAAAGGIDATASPLPIRRPTIHPFKSSTLSGSPGGLGKLQGSPKVPIPNPVAGLSSSPGTRLSSSPMGRASSSPGMGGRLPITRVPPSPVGGQFPFGSSNKPSPPFPSSMGSAADRGSLLERERAPSSLGDRASLLGDRASLLGERPPSSLGSGSDRDRRFSMTSDRDRKISLGSEQGNPERPTRKRYSSSFGHRYTGSQGAAGLAAIPATPGAVIEQGSRSSSPAVPGSPAPGSPLAPASGVVSPTGGRSPVVGSPLVAGRNLAASGGSAGSSAPGSGPVGDTGKNSYLSQATDDDDISAFVQHIDARKPLSGRVKQHNQSQQDDDTIRATGKGKEKERVETAFSGSSSPAPSAAATITARPSRPSPLAPFPTTTQARDREQASTAPELSTSPTSGGLMLTRQEEVEEKLKKMNETFMKTLEGISGSTRRKTATRERARVDSSPAPTPPAEERGDMSRDTSSPYLARRYPHNYYHQFQESVGSFASQGSEEVIGKMELDEGGSGRRR